MIRTMRRWVLGMILALMLGACGPVVYINEVTRNASDAVDVARTAQADKYAPYYWTRAVEYLRMARLDAEHADFQGANRFGRLAAEAATKAAADAEVAAKDPSKRPLEQAKPLAPAKGAVAPAKGE
jgi:hypothetical protein